jgi:hypothetical protein
VPDFHRLRHGKRWFSRGGISIGCVAATQSATCASQRGTTRRWHLGLRF